MSPEFYANIGVGVSVLAFLSGLTAIVLYLVSQVNRRIDRLEDSIARRFNRLEDKIDRMQEQQNVFDKRLLKLEWLLTYSATGQARPNPPDEEEE